MPSFLNLRSIFDLPSKLSRLEEINKIIVNHKDWQQIEEIRPLLQEKSSIEETIQLWEEDKKALEDLNVLYELAKEEKDTQILKEISDEISQLETKIKKIKLQWLLNQPTDKLNAIVEIHAGAGGTDAQDWAECISAGQKTWDLR